MMRSQQQEDHQSRVFYELSSLVFNLLRSPPVPFSDQSPPESVRRTRSQITPAGFASLMLGISMALMLCGTVTFLIGLIMMPWVLGLVMVLYVAGVVSTISMLGRSLFCYALAPPPRKDVPSWKLM